MALLENGQKPWKIEILPYWIDHCCDTWFSVLVKEYTLVSLFFLSLSLFEDIGSIGKDLCFLAAHH